MIIVSRPLSVTLPIEAFIAARDGSKRCISTQRNRRKDVFFETKIPQQAQIKCAGEESFLRGILRVEGTDTEWRIYI